MFEPSIPFSAQPDDIGLYRRAHEHDACGVAMVATLRGVAAVSYTHLDVYKRQAPCCAWCSAVSSSSRAH